MVNLGNILETVTLLRNSKLSVLAGFCLAMLTSGCLSSSSGSSVPLGHRPGDSGSLTASVLEIAAGDSQTAVVATALPTTIRIRVMNSLGQPIASESVSFVISSGAGALSQASVATDSSGYAESSWTLGTTSGAQSVTASIQSGSVSQVFSATALPGAAASLEFQTQPIASDVDVVLASAPRIRALDMYGNLATGFTSPVTLSLQTNPGTAALGGTATSAAVGGVVTFSDLTLNRGAVGYRLAATAGSLSVNSSLFNVRCAPILDSVAAPVVAYSLRKLRSAYAGAAFRARRTDGTQLDIGFDAANCGYDQAALQTFAGTTDAFVHTWYDQTTGGRNLVQTVNASQPRIVAAGVIEKENTRTIIRFLGVSFLPGTALGVVGTAGHAYSLVFRFVSFQNGGSNDGGGTYLVDRTSATNGLMSLKASAGQLMYQKRTDGGSGLAGITSTTAISTSGFQRVIAERARGVQYRLYVNGTLEASPADGDTDTTPPSLQIGRHADTTTGVYNLGISEFLFWSNPQSGGDRNAVDANQAKYF